MTEPNLGAIVIYCLTADDVEKINRRREHASLNMDYHRSKALGVMVHVGRRVQAGDTVPIIVTHLWGDRVVNGHCVLDGSDNFWATQVPFGINYRGAWQWCLG